MIPLTEQDNPARWQSSRRLGVQGEQVAADHLRSSGYRLVISNFKVPIGRNTSNAQITGEIDIIALDDEVLCFIEVKTRSSDAFADPISAVDLRKQRQIIRAARVYRRVFGIRNVKFRYDVVTVLIRTDERPVVELTKGFWNESKFRKRYWSGDLWPNA